MDNKADFIIHRQVYKVLLKYFIYHGLLYESWRILYSSWRKKDLLSKPIYTSRLLWYFYCIPCFGVRYHFILTAIPLSARKNNLQYNAQNIYWRSARKKSHSRKWCIWISGLIMHYQPGKIIKDFYFNMVYNNDIIYVFRAVNGKFTGR